MNAVREYFNAKYNKKGPAYLQGVLRTLGKLPPEDEELVPDHRIVEKDINENV